MTEIELNEQLAALLEKPEKEPGHLRRTGRRYRRRKGQEKVDRRLAIVQLSGYAMIDITFIKIVRSSKSH